MNYLSIYDFNIYKSVNDVGHLLLIIENKKYLYSFLSDIYTDSLVREYVKIYDENNKQQRTTDYVDFIPSLIILDINNKKNINAIIRYLKKECSETVEEFTFKMSSLIKEFYEKLKLESPIDIIHNEKITEDDVFKLLNLSIIDNHTSLVERIYCYIKIAFELRNIKIFMFYELSSFLKEDEIVELLKSCSYYGISIINIEKDGQNMRYFDCTKIIDSDNCLLE